ncbi:23S rRNA (uracil(1939)-C(5))-methyltransferase RlmD [Thioalkalivibrio sp. XN279]|uniref:23S rRNA (uracil(1939)-C(5))-methyltransferase RlmD n=1 Tax=Thioalkalivibrio sp. XN279 TaxID=2714953 RepID=UPI00140E5EA0|nr:23S rRNA (uracil(1939)-C(5))-methyltransferase RlmD [Thioalkalivibrio sp. XN279]NHA15246.1 23S rRNA (uracil(1939)-C(5))-methyltransferase RlmD [Thioalkalivibrio sp. XN279]
MSRRVDPTPFEVGILDLAHDGRGVARVEGKTVFVADALPGERVIASRVSQRRSHDEAELLEVLQPSPDRVTPRCPHFGTCGGCSLQHLAPAAQLAAKQDVLHENLHRIGRVVPEASWEPIPGPSWGYRRKARLGVRKVDKKGRVLVGFRERRAPLLADMDSCAVLAGGIGDMLPAIGALIASLSIARRVPQVEVAVGDDRRVLVFRVLDPPSADDLAQLAQFGKTRAVDVWLQPGGNETARPLAEDAPPPHYRLEEFDLEFEFLPTDFVQVNAVVNARAVARAVELLAPNPGQGVLDLFCGLGNFSLALARAGARVCGVEGDAALVQRARANAVRNGLEAEFHVANLFDDCRPLPWARRGYDGLLLDPPRAGAEAALGLVPALRPARIVYVSCHPGTLARDAGILVHEHGYRLSGAGVMDMFPHTAHIESIALFERQDRG